MNDRIHRALDGELPREDLTASERAEAAAFDAAANALRTSIGARAPRDIDAVVMKRIHDLALEPIPAAPAPRLVRAVRALWTPRTVSLRPAWALAAAAAIALLLWLPGIDRDSSSVAPAQTVMVQFRYDGGTASNVAVAGSFSGWQPSHVMQETAPGIWTTVLSVEPGVHDYVFVVDGQTMVPDPIAPQVDDGFGGVNSRLTVLPPSRGL